MTSVQLAFLLIAILFGSALTIQILVFPPLLTRITDRSGITRVSSEILKKHHTLALLILTAACTLFFRAAKWPAGILAAILLLINLYQRFWIFTKIHLVKQPIGVQDLIQPDNVLREEFNRLQKTLYFLFRLHLLLVFIDLILAAF